MRSSIRMALIVSVFVFMTGPAWAGHGKALGSVAQANNSLVDNDTAMAGANVYACDVLDTDNFGELRAQFRDSQIVLGTSSEVVLDGSPDAVRVIVVNGSTSFAAPSSAALIIDTPAGTLRESSNGAYTGTVAITGPNELVVSAVRGTIILNAGGAANTIPAGKSARITFDHAENTGCRRPGYIPHPAPGDVNLKIIGDAAAILGGGTVAVAVWRELDESETKPDEF